MVSTFLIIILLSFIGIESALTNEYLNNIKTLLELEMENKDDKEL